MSTSVMGLLLFLPAGTLAWPQAWMLLALFAGGGGATALWLRRTDPDLLRERSESVVGAGQRPRDRLTMAALLAFFCAWLVFMALDARRFGGAQVPPLGQALGAALICATYVGFGTVFRANRFAITQIRLQKERGQTVISTGPYAVVRHPMYGYALLMILGVPLLLGSLWGMLGILVAAPLFAVRAIGEEALLSAGLPGYRRYAQTVRFRLLPGIW